MQTATHWSSRNGFILTTIGAAVGLGNLWRFPYIAGENGGAGFVLIYLGFVFLIGLPIMLAELILGRLGKRDALTTIIGLTKQSAHSKAWHAIGYISLIVPFVGLSYYAVVAAWSLDYLSLSALNRISDVAADGAAATFENRIGNWPHQVFLHGLFILVAGIVVSKGVKNGLEKASRFAMPLLFLILIFLVVHNAFASNFSDSLVFLFTPDFSAITTQSVLIALGQALFSLAIGVGVMITFGAYVPKDVSLSKSGIVICIGDTSVALLAGLAIFPIVFQSGLDPAEGPGLIFVTLPIAFAGIHWTWVLSTLFFLLLFFAAFTTALGMLEPMVSFVINRTGLTRAKATVLVGTTSWILGLGSVLSFGPLQSWFPLETVGLMLNKTFFDVMDYFVANILLPTNALLIAIFMGWRLKTSLIQRELVGMSSSLVHTWRLVLRYLAPIGLCAIIYDLWINS
ncbi:MAG: sodium-dependent transporter [Pseudomonadota bacterium]